MAVSFQTNSPNNLLATFKKLIDDGKVVTWAYDSDGDFTHTPPQWKQKAWLRPRIADENLTLSFLAHSQQITSKELYAVYHGRFIESMLAHCDTIFTNAVATALPVRGDRITKISA